MERRVALWLLVAEQRVFDVLLVEGRIPGLQMLFLGVAGYGEERSLRATVYLLPAALPGWTPEADDYRTVIYASDDAGEREPIEVVSAPWDLTLHASVGLTYATLSCWMRRAGDDLLVSVRHAVAEGYLDLDDGSAAPVVWVAPNCLDAAAALGPGPLAPIPLAVGWPMALPKVEALTKAGAVDCWVKERGRTYGTITAANPHLFVLDRPLVPGDSGSLIRVAEGGPALGIYIGSLKTPDGPAGLCQGLHQVQRLAEEEREGFEGFYEEV